MSQTAAETGLLIESKHRRYFRVAGITVRVESDLDFDAVRFKPRLTPFAVACPGDDTVTIRHHFELPEIEGKDFGKELYRKVPWAISRKNGTWYYCMPPLDESGRPWHLAATFSADHSQATIYSPPETAARIRATGWDSLSLLTTDQVWLVPLLALRQAAMLHSAAAILNRQGLLFVGHSEAGKSTTVTMLKSAASAHSSRVQVEILCDDRNIVRRWDDGWRVHGTWSHGDVADVSSASAPLRAILFLRRDTRNELTPLIDRREVWRRLLATIIKPMVTAEWWQKELDVLTRIVNEVPCYIMHFDKSGAIVDRLATL